MQPKILLSVENVDIGIIGGSGLYHLDHLHVLGEYTPTTPWGKPSDALIICQTDQGIKIAFLARHARGHPLNPSEVPYRANIAALKHVGCKVIIAFSAVGSLQEEIAPQDFVIPTQVIDRTKGIRPSTFFEGGVVGHVAFADPFTPELCQLIYDVSKNVSGLKTHHDKLLICMEGPAFSTRAESNLYRSWGGDVINMSCMPEAKLAAEAEICYAMICMSTDYDCWKQTEEPVTVEAVLKNLSKNSANAKELLVHLLPILEQQLDSDWIKMKKGTGSNSVCTAPDKKSAEAVGKLKYIFTS